MSSLNKRESTPIESSAIEVQMDHRTIRAFMDESLTEDELMALYKVTRHTAFFSFLQQATIIHVTNPAVHERLRAAPGQPCVGGTRGEFLVFVTDQYRDSCIREESGVGNAPLYRMSLLLTALHDALLAAQNVVVATESMSLGTCYSGSVHADPRAMIEALGLPELTFPVFGLFVGHLDQKPQFKPHLPPLAIVAENSYPRVNSYSELITDYDEAITDYYDMCDTSKRIESFSTLVHTTVGVADTHISLILEALNEQDFALE